VRIDGLTVATTGGRAVLDTVDLELAAGRALGLVGRSGAGKTTLAQALVGHLRPGLHHRAGRARVAGADVFALDPTAVRALRRGPVRYVAQDAGASLTPTMRLERLLAEALGTRPRDPEVLGLLDAVRLPAERSFARRFPHELSGGQRQRVLLALALAGRPRLLVLDEPTTALDTVTQAQILDLLAGLRARYGFGVVLVAHDLRCVAAVCDELAVLDAGTVAERGATTSVLAAPRSTAGRALVHAASALLADLPAPPDPGEAPPPVPLLRARGLRARHGDRRRRTVALDGVDLSVGAGRAVALVGASGSGKTTLARCLLGLHAPSAGRVELGGVALAARARDRREDVRRRLAHVPQEPGTALNPRHTAGAIIGRAARLRGDEPDVHVPALLAAVELPERLARRRPHELSGGEAQRVAIARALALRPDVLVCDEPTSALDAVTRTGLVELLDRLRRDRGLALILIAHDLALVARVADEVAVLDAGRIVEQGPPARLLRDPRHPATRALVHAAGLARAPVSHERAFICS